MRNNFKPLGIAAAVAAVTAGHAHAVPSVSNNGLGDLALVPYYTVNDDHITGIHIINTSDMTQVVKVRMRRGADSMDALDFNLILSPQDMWVGFVNETDSGQIAFTTADNSCTAPNFSQPNADGGGTFIMPEIYREGAEEGYLEFIAMGEIAVDSEIGVASKHVAGVPADCAAVRSNFFSIGSAYPGTAGSPAQKGVINHTTTHQTTEAGVVPNVFSDSGNALKVSYFIRDNASGVEFGGDAFHIADFLDEPSMSNQQAGLSSGDLSGFDYPDLNGGSVDGADRNLFEALRANDVLGALAVANDWSANAANGVSTDWVLTMPGQYTMLDLATYTDGFDTTGVTGAEDCLRGTGISCDNRDIPVNITLDIYDREEGSFTPDPGDLVVSPQPPQESQEFRLTREVNVIQWNGSTGVLGSADPTEVDSNLNPLDATFGWANVSVESTASPAATCNLQAFFTANGNDGTLIEQNANSSAGYECTAVTGDVPVIGMVAWERNVASNPDASYGRIVDHSYITSS